MNIFIIQLLASFLVGGGVVAILSFLAERADERIAGLILSFPSTVALAFFFLGWSLSAEEVSRMIPTVIIPLGLSVLFASSYVSIAIFIKKFFKKKFYQVLVTAFLSTSSWFILAIISITSGSNNVILATVIYITLAIISHFLINQSLHQNIPAIKYNFYQKILRATFMGFVIFLVVLLGRLLGPLWGGLLSMFPAALSSTLVILHWHYEPSKLSSVAQGVPLGSISIFVYVIAVMLLFPIFGFLLGTLLAYTTSLLTSLLLIRTQRL